MNPMDQASGWTVSRRLMLAFGILVFAVAMTAWINTSTVQKTAGSIDEAMFVIIDGMQSLKDIQVGSLAVLSEARDYALFHEEDALARLHDANTMMEQGLEDYMIIRASREGVDEELNSRFQIAILNLKTEAGNLTAVAEAIEKGYQVGDALAVAARDLDQAEAAFASAFAAAYQEMDMAAEGARNSMQEMGSNTAYVQIATPIIILFLTVVIGVFLARSILDPLEELTAGTRLIAAGNLDHRIGHKQNEDESASNQATNQASSPVLARDEFGVLGRAFNAMTDQLSDTLDKERQSHAELEQVNLVIRQRASAEQEQREQLQRILEQVREGANTLSAAAAEILAATTQQVSGASEQSAAISQTTTTVDEVKVIAEQTAARAQEVADMAQQTVNISRSGRQSVQETIEAMSRIKTRVEGIAENILALSEQTQQIDEIISTVNDIASQSKMLALNASVEAARAGEHGKGFAAVAVEVRSLAEQSKQATSQVRSILQEIQGATNATVMATEEGTKGVSEGIKLVGEMQEVIDQLGRVIDESAQAAVQMVAGGRQQASGVEQIAVAMRNINQATIQGLASTRQAEKASQDLNGLAVSLTDIVATYSDEPAVEPADGRAV